MFSLLTSTLCTVLPSNPVILRTSFLRIRKRHVTSSNVCVFGRTFRGKQAFSESGERPCVFFQNSIQIEPIDIYHLVPLTLVQR